MTPDDYARDLADRAAGGTLVELHVAVQTAHDNLTIWSNTYRAALAATPEPTDAEPLLTVADVAARLNCCKRSVYDLIRAGKLPKVDIFDGIVRVRPADLDALIQGDPA